MASLFALGVMSALWMAVVAGLIAIEKTLPWRRTATYGTAVVLLTLGVLVLAAPAGSPRPHRADARTHVDDPHRVTRASGARCRRSRTGREGPGSRMGGPTSLVPGTQGGER
jgi:hypothetical protein